MSSSLLKSFDGFLQHLKYNPTSSPGLQRPCLTWHVPNCLIFQPLLLLYPLCSCYTYLLPFLECVKLVLTTGPLHQLFSLPGKHRCLKSMCLLIMKTSPYISRCSKGCHSDCFNLLAHITICYFLVYFSILCLHCIKRYLS